jgi:hypothetical protein
MTSEFRLSVQLFLKSCVIIFASQKPDTMAPFSVPNMDEATIRASSLPVMRTATHIYFFGYEGPDPEVCFQ